MLIHTSTFVISNTNYTLCPKTDRPEYAFIGRSNVGKSSLINMLVNHKDLAKTSGKPGKTQLINHFIINEKTTPWYLVDLPGYGYAKTAKDNATKWSKFTADYILKRTNLLCLFVLIDVRLEPQKIDIEFIEWLAENQMAFCMIFTKADKLSKAKLAQSVEDYKKHLSQSWDELPEMFISSAPEKSGREEVLKFIEETNKLVPFK
jgi:GTP-binding protein